MQKFCLCPENLVSNVTSTINSFCLDIGELKIIADHFTYFESNSAMEGGRSGLVRGSGVGGWKFIA